MYTSYVIIITAIIFLSAKHLKVYETALNILHALTHLIINNLRVNY